MGNADALTGAGATLGRTPTDRPGDRPTIDARSLAALLATAGIDADELTRIGAAEAYARVRRVRPALTIETFYALEVATDDLRSTPPATP